MLPKARDEAGRWKCGSNVWDKLTGGEHFHTTDLCCEREGHNETKRDLQAAQCNREEWVCIAEKRKIQLKEAWALVNAMAGQEPWDRAEEWLEANKAFKPDGIQRT